MNKRESRLVCFAVRALGVLGLLASSLTLAQQNCNPSTPQVVSGVGFSAFGAREEVLARGGNAGPAWEWALGTDTDLDGQSVKADLDWVSGKSYGWTLIYSGTGARVELRDGGTLLFTRTFPTGMDRGNALHFQVSTNPSIGPDTTISATVTQINGHAVAASLQQSGNKQAAEQNRYYFFPPMANGFMTQGTVALTFPAGRLPTGSRVLFKVRSGNIACASTNSPPTVSLTSPRNNAVFSAPAMIDLVANAQDSDGTVKQVEFFQGASLLATDTSAPYTFTLNNVAAGSYSFTARATDNLGAATTSAAINVTVTAPAQAQMFFIHTDHLNTPRLITNQAGQAVWSWENSDPFGYNAPNENPAGLGNFTCNLRLPGQYFDRETNLHYNYFRDYDPGIGRYVQSDPIGLFGGLNTYGYAHSDPIGISDSFGLYRDPMLDIANRVAGIPSSNSPPPLAKLFREWRRGNVWGGFEKQDWICTAPAPASWNSDICKQKCCIQHDKCYDDYQCNWTSWEKVLSLWTWLATPCARCNVAAVACLLNARSGCNVCR